MTDQPTCEQCSRPIADGAYVCTTCTTCLERHLADVVLIAGEAMTTIARLARIGSDGGGPTEPPEPQNWAAGHALAPTVLPVDLDAAAEHEAAVSELMTWVRHVEETSGIQARADAGEHPLASAAQWLSVRLDWLRRRPEAAEAWADLHHACAALLRVVDRPPARWYAGPCTARTMTGQCPEELHPIAGARTHRCRCGAQHDLAQRKTWLLGELADVWATAPQCAHAMTTLGLPTSASTIRTWAQRGRLAPHPESLPAHPRYRIGSVQELAEQVLVRRAAPRERLTRSHRETQDGRSTTMPRLT